MSKKQVGNVYRFPIMGKRFVVDSDWRNDFIAMANYMDAVAVITGSPEWVRAIAKETRKVARL